ncbi:MAG: DEAD/DEAH box helicase [Acidimicrobiaceae bacterium]|nr:DEAD/DEAH box helicase [Acidimicrobiaceae bacterium]
MSELRDHFIESQGFGLDNFQIRALDAVDDDVNVLVSAPTGSGKTLVATYALTRTLAQGRRAFYTTPLKALSNQKYHELCDLFGEDRVGLLTGDTSINRGADVVVMTTEVLRNMLLTESQHLRHLGLVILDEVHFLQDPFRGGVWEEVLILTPAPVRFVALSATIGNATTLGEWLSEIRGSTRVIVETERPITLHQHVAVVRRGSETPDILDLLDGERLSDGARRIDTTMRSTRRFRPGPKWHGPQSSAPPAPFRSPRRSELLLALDDADLLPVIVFIFSRAACDDAVRQCRRDGLLFTTPEQRREIERVSEERLVDFSHDDLTALEHGEFLDSLRRGMAAHHAGMVPAFREIVETCFERGLLSVVFATETLALGVNMPARSVALERFAKYSDDGRRFLTAGEYAQMTGRAGRRGLDDEGHAIVCFSPEVSMVDVGRVAISQAGDLHSSFRPTYNFTANLIERFDQPTAVEVVRRSYAQFEADRRPGGAKRSLADQMSARHRVLEDLGYASGWALNDRGNLLRALYHELDLLVADCVLAGIFDGLEPSQLVGLASAFAFESRRASRNAKRPSTPVKKRKHVNDRLGSERRASLQERLSEVQARYATIHEVEERHRVPHTREPDGAFAPVLAAWARGVSLSTVLDLAEVEVGSTSPGDFVRHAKQVSDLLEQFARLDVLGELAETAASALDLVMRSVVAGASTVHPRG